MKIHILPTGQVDLDHAQTTLLNPVPQGILSQELSQNDMQTITGTYGKEPVPTWGWIPGKVNTLTWEDLQFGDIATFVIPSNDQVVIAKVTHKVRSKNLASRLWGTDKASGETWELVFFLQILGAMNLSKRDLLSSLGYTNENDNLQGHRDVTDRFLKRFGSVDGFLARHDDVQIPLGVVREEVEDKLISASLPKRMSDEERLARLKEALEQHGSTPDEYVEVNGKRFRRSQVVVAYVKERDRHRCRACGWELTKRNGGKYIEAAHIIRRAPTEGGVAGPDHPDNMIALCPNCHKKFDYGDDAARKEVLAEIESRSSH